ncbi:MAG TPA: secretin N-terminal domain-containing protein [Planctomycetota bacterium]|nr:secretin N-terminal domain-containing protein [Planctomycetota bacterium]
MMSSNGRRLLRRRLTCLGRWAVLIVLVGGIAAAQDPPSEPKLEFKFRNADISAVFQYVSRQTGFTFLVDNNAKPKLLGTVDAYSETPVPAGRVLEFLDTVLKSRELTTYTVGKVVTIFRVEDAINKNFHIQQGADPDSVDDTDKIITQIIPLRNLKAADFEKNLRRLYPRAVDTLVDPVNNLIIMRGASQEIRRFLQVLSYIDKAGVGSLSIEIFRLKNASAADMAKVLTDTFKEPPAPRQGGSSRRQARLPDADPLAADTFRVATDARTNSIVVTATQERLAAVAKLVADLDNNLLETVELRSYHLKHADPAKMAATISDIFGKASRSGSDRPAGISQREWRAILQSAQESATQQVEVRAIPDIRTSTVVVYCSKAQAPHIDALVSELDRNVDELLKMRVYTLRNGDAITMAATIRGLFTSDIPRRLEGRSGDPAPAGGGVTAETVVVQTDIRTNSLIVIASSDNLLLVDGLIASLDSKPSEDQATYVFHLKNANAVEVQEIIKGFQRGGVVLQGSRGIPGQPGPGSRTPQNRQPDQGGFEMPGPQVPGGGGRPRNLGLHPDELQDEPTPQPPPGRQDEFERPPLVGPIDVQADPSTNSLFVRTSPRNFPALQKMLTQLDTFRPQVLIRALIAEVTLDKRTEFGVEGFWENGVRLGGNDRAIGRATTDFGGQIGGFSYRLVGDEFDIGLRALAEEGRLKVLATPRILTLDNQEASITAGKLVPFIQSSRQTPEGSIINTIQYQDVGIVLRVTPHINEDGLVTMLIHPEVSEVASASESVQVSEGVRAPTFNRNAADATVAVRNGQTVVLGGLIREFEDDVESGIPILKDLPLLGILFSRSSKVRQRREMMIFITPHIVYSHQELEELTELEKSQLKALDPRLIEVKGREWRRFIRDDGK